MDAPNPPAEIVRDSAGEPVLQGTEEVEFAAYIPNVVLQNLETRSCCSGVTVSSAAGYIVKISTFS